MSAGWWVALALYAVAMPLAALAARLGHTPTLRAKYTRVQLRWASVWLAAFWPLLAVVAAAVLLTGWLAADEDVSP